MKRVIYVLTLVGFCLMGTNLMAQIDSGNKSNDDEKYELLNKIISHMPKISGVIQPGYYWNDKNAGNNSSFQVKRMRLFITEELSKTFELKTQFELFSSSPDGGTYSKNLISLMDAFINVKLDPAFNLRVGQFYMPVGFENFDTSPATLEVVDFSLLCYRMVTRNAVSFLDKIDYGRDIGVMAYGEFLKNKSEDFNHISYQLAVTNGRMATLIDDNKSKDIIGRLTIKPIKDLRLVGGYTWGEYPNADKTDLYNPMSRYTLGAWYSVPKGINIRSEYGHLQSDKANVDEDAFYALASYDLDKIIPVIRYERYRDNTHKNSILNKDMFLAGATYKFTDKVKLQLNYIRTEYTDDALKSGIVDGGGNGVQAMVVLLF